MELWTRQTEAAPIEGWEPAAVDTEGGPRRPGRAIAGLVLVSTLAVGAWMAAANGSEQDRLASVTDASASMLPALDGLAALASDLSDGEVDDDLGGGVALGALDAAARRLFEAASRLEPEPETASVRLGAIEAARRAMEIEDLVGDAIAYDNAFAVIFQRPPLPGVTTPAGVTDVALDVAEWVGRVADATASLPHHSHLGDHRRDAVDLSERLEEWQVSYLDALRSGETELAHRLVDEISRRLATLDSELHRSLSAVATDASAGIDTLAADITRITAG